MFHATRMRHGYDHSLCSGDFWSVNQAYTLDEITAQLREFIQAAPPLPHTNPIQGGGLGPSGVNTDMRRPRPSIDGMMETYGECLRRLRPEQRVALDSIIRAL